jgi:hypothetical protein
MINIILTGVLSLVTIGVLAGELPLYIFPQSDTLKIVSVGENNSIVVDSIQANLCTKDSLTLSTLGEITQTGKNNTIEIGNNKLNTKQKISITQTGKNNKVKINSK